VICVGSLVEGYVHLFSRTLLNCYFRSQMKLLPPDIGDVVRLVETTKEKLLFN